MSPPPNHNVNVAYRQSIIRAYYILIAAITGAVVLALEVLTARTMAPALGSGAITWSALLAVALGMLAIGNLTGGFLSERVTPCGLISWSLTASSTCLLLVSQYYAAAMRWSASQPLLIGLIAAALITQAVPLGLLGSITPVILHNGQSGPGRWGGKILAFGSCGGIIGAIATGLVLLPGLGLTRSYLILSGLLGLTALPAVWPNRRWLAAGFLLVSLALSAVCWYCHKHDAAVQSAYGQLEIRDTGLSHVLLIDGMPQTGLPTQFGPGDGLRCGYLLEAALLMRPKSSRALVIGLGAGLAPRLLAAHDINCESLEIDPNVLEIARDKFGFIGHATIADGRAFLRDTSKHYDLIFLDTCTADCLAYHLFTVEALHTLHNRLSPGGVAVIQFIGDDGIWSASLLRTVRAVFDDYLMLAGRAEFGRVGPRWLFASCGRLLNSDQVSVFMQNDKPWEAIRPIEFGYLLTDDHFPAELDWVRIAIAWRLRFAYIR